MSSLVRLKDGTQEDEKIVEMTTQNLKVLYNSNDMAELSALLLLIEAARHGNCIWVTCFEIGLAYSF